MLAVKNPNGTNIITRKIAPNHTNYAGPNTKAENVPKVVKNELERFQTKIKVMAMSDLCVLDI